VHTIFEELAKTGVGVKSVWTTGVVQPLPNIPTDICVAESL